MTGRVAAFVLLAALLVAGLALAGVAQLRSEPLPARVAAPPLASLAPGADSGPELARAACVQLRLAAQGIRAGSAAEVVRGQLAAARALAAQALRQDPASAGLSGGVAALDESVRRDDAGGAAAGIRVALAECERLAA